MQIKNLKPIVSHFYKWEEATPEATFLRQPSGDSWKTYSWQEAGIEARKIATYLNENLGEGRHNIGILSKNCAHWIMADLAIFISNNVSVPYYANSVGEQLNNLIKHSEIKILFVGKLENWDKVKNSIPEDVKVISFPHYEGNQKIDMGTKWEDLLNQCNPLEGNPLPNMSDLFTIMYTSGTTGNPKGVMLSNIQPASLLENERKHNDLELFSVNNPRFFSYLPLNHIAERVIVEMAALSSGGSISFVESLDTFAKNLKDTQPDAFLAVPRIWTKFQMAILAKLPQKKLSRLLSIPIISSIIKKKLKNNLGLSRAKIVLTGAAPISEVTLRWYKKIGITVQEVYAMTENCGGCSLMRKNALNYGTVGKALTNCKIKLAPGTNEVLVQADWVMDGYYKEAELSAEILKDGYLHTGDQGSIDEEGFLTLTGRVKDTFKSGKGEFVVPGPIELEFESNSFIEQICVVGLGLPQPLALIVLSEHCQKYNNSDVEKNLHDTIVRVNEKLVKHERLKALILLNENWTVENEMLTPTMKIKRSEIDKRYKSNYHDWYENGPNVIWA
jgi:long-subunit acyl-CoA synthetase (AMP-forming)